MKIIKKCELIFKYKYLYSIVRNFIGYMVTLNINDN